MLLANNAVLRDFMIPDKIHNKPVFISSFAERQIQTFFRSIETTTCRTYGVPFPFNAGFRSNNINSIRRFTPGPDPHFSGP